MSRITDALSGRRTGRVVTIAAAATVSAAIAAPMAIGSNEGESVKGGQRNGTYSSETKVIANNSVFGTRQSNLGGGGGAIYGCRAATGAEGCIEASNLNNGQAFNFRFNGVLGGSINTDAAKKEDARPFTTNATGVATGLNADRVDGKDAQQIVEEAKAGTKTTVVTAQGALANQRGFTAAAREAEGRYLVTADSDVTKCVPQVTVYGTDATPGSTATVENVGANQYRIRTQSSANAAVDRQVALTVTC